jgi:NAD+ kinase
VTAIRSAIVFADRRRAGVEDALVSVCDQLGAVVDVTIVDLGDASLRTVSDLPGEIGIVLGGDGTILSIARAHGDAQRPLLGINLGKLGYLAEFGMTDLADIATLLRSGTLEVSRRLMLEVHLANGESNYLGWAVNDIVLHAGPPYRMIDLTLMLDGQRVCDVKGDGLIIATPTGSTGHNISAGGPVVDSSTSAIVVTPICPHSLTHRPLVVSGQASLQVIARHVHPGSTMIIDGQVSVTLTPDAVLDVAASSASFLLVHNRQYSHWHILQSKLHWGIGPNYKE